MARRGVHEGEAGASFAFSVAESTESSSVMASLTLHVELPMIFPSTTLDLVAAKNGFALAGKNAATRTSNKGGPQVDSHGDGGGGLLDSTRRRHHNEMVAYSTDARVAFEQGLLEDLSQTLNVSAERILILSPRHTRTYRPLV